MDGGVYNFVSHAKFPFSAGFEWRMRWARLITAHQIGTVLDRASGILFPERVESTRIKLFFGKLILEKKWGVDTHRLPSSFNYKWKEVKIWTAKVEAPIIEMTISRLEVCWNVGRLRGYGINRKIFIDVIKLTSAGSVYQAPQRRLASTSYCWTSEEMQWPRT